MPACEFTGRQIVILDRDGQAAQFRALLAGSALVLAGVGLGVDCLDEAVHCVPYALLDLWAFGPDGVQFQFDGAPVWSAVRDLQLAVVIVGSL